MTCIYFTCMVCTCSRFRTQADGDLRVSLGGYFILLIMSYYSWSIEIIRVLSGADRGW